MEISISIIIHLYKGMRYVESFLEMIKDAGYDIRDQIKVRERFYLE